MEGWRDGQGVRQRQDGLRGKAGARCNLSPCWPRPRSAGLGVQSWQTMDAAAVSESVGLTVLCCISSTAVTVFSRGAVSPFHCRRVVR